MLSIKKIFLVCCLLIIASAAEAQYIHEPVVINGSRVYVDGEKLSKEQAVATFNGAGMGQDFQNYRAGYKAGLGLTIGGSVLTVGGGMTFFAGMMSAFVGGILSTYVGIADVMTGGDHISTSQEVSPYFKRASILLNIGGYASLAGAACLISGIPTLCVYKNRLGDLEHEYNKTATSSIEVTLGGQNHGFGLAVNF